VQHLHQGFAATAGRREDEDAHASRREPEARVVVDEVAQHELVGGGGEGDEVEPWREEPKRRLAGRGAGHLAEDGTIGRWRGAFAEERHPAEQGYCGYQHHGHLVNTQRALFQDSANLHDSVV